MKPEVLHRKGHVRIIVVAFRYDRATSSGYVWVREPEEAARQVLRFLSEPNKSDVISIRRVYLNEEQLKELEKEEELKAQKAEEQNAKLVSETNGE